MVSYWDSKLFGKAKIVSILNCFSKTKMKNMVQKHLSHQKTDTLKINISKEAYNKVHFYFDLNTFFWFKFLVEFWICFDRRTLIWFLSSIVKIIVKVYPPQKKKKKTTFCRYLLKYTKFVFVKLKDIISVCV